MKSLSCLNACVHNIWSIFHCQCEWYQYLYTQVTLKLYIISNQYVQTFVLISDQYLYYFCNRYLWLISKQMCTGHLYSLANNCVFDISDQYLYIPVYMLFLPTYINTGVNDLYLHDCLPDIWYLYHCTCDIWSISGHLQYLLLIHTPLCKITCIGVYIQVYTYK